MPKNMFSKYFRMWAEDCLGMPDTDGFNIVKNLTAEEQRQKDIERARKVFRRIGRQLPKDFDLMEQLRADRERDNAGEES